MARLTASIGALIAELSPAYFALVMSTGILSIACRLLGFGFLASLLFWLNFGLYLLLWLLTLLRLSLFPRQLLDDLGSPARGMGFFTMVAATGILGAQLVIILAAGLWAAMLLILGLGLGFFFMSAVFATIAAAGSKPPLTAALNGFWLVAPVSSQSLSILACLVAAQFPGYQNGLLFLALCLFLVGGLLALLILNLLFYRLMFRPLTPEDFEPTYWITMGVNAVSALAGATLATTRSGPGLLASLHDVLVSLTVFFWAAATWSLPFLVIMMVWRHLIRGVGFSYSPSYWGLVFPLGMYATCTFHLAGLTNLPVLADLARGCLYVALAAWLLTFLGMLRSLLRSLAAQGP